MDLSELPTVPGSLPQSSAAPAAGPDDGFRDLLGQLGREVAAPMTAAL